MASCSNDAAYTPGAEGADDTRIVYFEDIESTISITDENQDSILLNVYRKNTDQEWTLPLISSDCDVALEMPTSVHFDKGEDSTAVIIRFPGLEAKHLASFTLMVDSANSNPYNNDGTCILQSGIIRSAWEVLVDSVMFSSSSGLYPEQGTKVEYLPGAGNRFRFKDFLGSGNPLEFSLIMDEGVTFDSENLRNNHGRLNPLKNYYQSSSSTYGGYWTWSNDGDYSPWLPKNGYGQISQMDFYNEYYGTSGDYVDFRCNSTDEYTRGGKTFVMDFDHVGVELTYTYMVDAFKSNWDYIYIYCYYLKDNGQ